MYATPAKRPMYRPRQRCDARAYGFCQEGLDGLRRERRDTHSVIVPPIRQGFPPCVAFAVL